MSAASSVPPNRSRSRCGAAKAHSNGTCWSSTMPIRRASGSLDRSASASGSPESASFTGTTAILSSEGEEDPALAGGGAVDARPAARPSAPGTQPLDLDLQQQLVAGADDAPEAHLLHPAEQRQL